MHFQTPLEVPARRSGLASNPTPFCIAGVRHDIGKSLQRLFRCRTPQVWIFFGRRTSISNLRYPAEGGEHAVWLNPCDRQPMVIGNIGE
jgi:hypothetical protein